MKKKMPKWVPKPGRMSAGKAHTCCVFDPIRVFITPSAHDASLFDVSVVHSSEGEQDVDDVLALPHWALERTLARFVDLGAVQWERTNAYFAGATAVQAPAQCELF